MSCKRCKELKKQLNEATLVIERLRKEAHYWKLEASEFLTELERDTLEQYREERKKTGENVAFLMSALYLAGIRDE